MDGHRFTVFRGIDFYGDNTTLIKTDSVRTDVVLSSPVQRTDVWKGLKRFGPETSEDTSYT